MFLVALLFLFSWFCIMRLFLQDKKNQENKLRWNQSPSLDLCYRKLHSLSESSHRISDLNYKQLLKNRKDQLSFEINPLRRKMTDYKVTYICIALPRGDEQHNILCSFCDLSYTIQHSVWSSLRSQEINTFSANYTRLASL